MQTSTHISFAKIVATILAVCFIAAPFRAHAEAPKTMQVSPAVIDEKAKQRDIIKESITITNTSSKFLNLFPAVEDINPQDGDQSFAVAQNASERSDSLANWIELSRGVIELSPGETKTIPFVIHVNLNAVPGTYHAAITFTTGTTRGETESKNPDGVAQINVEVKADIKEDLQLLKFSTDRIVFSGDDVLFDYDVINNGNQDLAPSGDIRIYDRRGQEIASVDVNKTGKPISPQQSAQLASVWSAVNGFGQYKAIITMNYGKTQTASVQDTIFFWIIPWKQLLGLFTAVAITMAILAMYFHRLFEERHLNKLAMAGLLKTHPVTAAALSNAVAYLPHFPTEPVPPKRPPPPKVVESPKEPKERIVVRVAENIVIAWRLFTTFKRSGRLTPEDIAQKKAVTLIARSEDRPMQIAAPVPEMPKAAPIMQNEVGTINLKHAKPQRKDYIHEGHVVNLKKNL